LITTDTVLPIEDEVLDNDKTSSLTAASDDQLMSGN
jgi:hypothetical protein